MKPVLALHGGAAILSAASASVAEPLPAFDAGPGCRAAARMMDPDSAQARRRPDDETRARPEAGTVPD